MVNYIFYSVAGLGLSYFLYHLILKPEKSLRFNRFYLLGSLVLCLLAPLLDVDPGFSGTAVPKVDFDQLVGTSSEVFEEKVPELTVEKMERQTSIIPQVLLSLYLLVSAFFLFRFIRNLGNIYRLIQGNNSVEVENLKLVPVEESKNPFSFFRYLFINQEDLRNNNYSASVIKHEATHSAQLHSLDILLLELLSCFFWFNPFLWLYKKAVLANHEYLADAAVIEAGIRVEVYSEQLIQSGNKTQHFQLISGFSFIQTKNRLIMLHTKRSSKTVRTAKILSTLALFALVFSFSSFTHRSNEPFKVVVDAGHGGNDPGNMNEKAITLQIALELKALSNEKEVEIILIRDSDVFFSLKERSEFVESQNADMFISLHCNFAPSWPDVSGIEAFYSEKSKQPELSRKYSKILLAQQLGEVTDKAEIKTANFLLLRDRKIPAVFLELGFLSNPREKARLEDPEYQKLMAANIYKGLLKIRETR